MCRQPKIHDSQEAKVISEGGTSAKNYIVCRFRDTKDTGSLRRTVIANYARLSSSLFAHRVIRLGDFAVSPR